MPHKGELHDGEHEAIIDQEIWDAVQEQLRRNTVRRHRDNNSSTQSLLTGLLVDEDGERLAPTYATKSGRRYRYYVSASLKDGSAIRGAGWRLPAPAVEQVVLSEICRWLRDRHRLIEVFGSNRSDPSRLEVALSGAARHPQRIAIDHGRLSGQHVGFPLLCRHKPNTSKEDDPNHQGDGSSAMAAGSESAHPAIVSS
jgi:hypothetical protein